MVNQQPDNYEDARQTGGAAGWAAFVILVACMAFLLYCVRYHVEHFKSGSLVYSARQTSAVVAEITKGK